MELITFTTAQIHSIFAALSCAAVAGFIFYCIGLRTGKAAGLEQGREETKSYRLQTIDHLRASLWNANRQLAGRDREAMALRENIKAEAKDHAKVERGLLNRLAAAAPQSDEDHAVMLAVGAKLELAAGTFADLGSHDHARLSRHLMAQVLDIADRIKKAQANAQPHPDTDLLDWLDENALVNFDLETAELRFPAYHPTEAGYDTLRDLLREAMANNETVDRNHSELLQAAVAQEDAA